MALLPPGGPTGLPSTTQLSTATSSTPISTRLGNKILFISQGNEQVALAAGAALVVLGLVLSKKGII